MCFPEWYILISAVKSGTSVAMAVQRPYVSVRFYPLKEAGPPFIPALIGSKKWCITFSHVYASLVCLSVTTIEDY